MTKQTVTLSDTEAESLFKYISENVGVSIEILSESVTGIGDNTYVQVTGKPRTRQDITDYTCW